MKLERQGNQSNQRQSNPNQSNQRQRKIGETKGQSTSTKRSDSNEPLLNIIRAYAHGLPSGTQHSEVALVTPLSVLLSGGEELVCLFRELFCYRSETNLTLEVVLELIPLRLFGVVCCAVGGSAASPAPRRAYHAPQGSRARQREQPTPRMAHPAHTARTHEVGLTTPERNLTA